MQTRIQGLMTRARWLVPAAALSMWGCPNQELAPLEPCTVSGVNLDAAGDGVDKVDVLFAIDNSGSMAQEQNKLGTLLPNLVGVLTTGNKSYPNPAATPDDKFTPAKSLHVGVITSNMGRPPGVTSTASAACSEDNGQSGGGGGILQASGAIASMPQIDANTKMQVKAAVPACARVNISPNYIAYGDGLNSTAPEDPNNPLFAFTCIATVGVGGCGIEQHLEAIWKALAPTSNNTFYGPNTTGNADTFNKGFARPDSVLAIIQVADEDDCSVTPSGGLMFERDGTPAVNVRCQILKDQDQYKPLIQPIDRYATGLIGLRGAYPERLVYAAIVGLPQGDGINYDDPDGLLRHPQMQVGLTADGKDINSVCGSDMQDGKAYPGRRAVELAKAIGAGKGAFVLRSICDPSYTSALNLVIDKIAKQLSGACLPRPLQKDPTKGTVTCDVVEILAKDSNGADIGNCTTVPGRVPAAVATRKVNGMDRTACTVTQLVAGPNGSDPGGAGWYYDDASDELATIPGCKGGQRVVFSKSAPLQSSALARVECYQPQPRVAQNTRGFAAINTSCATDNTLCTSVSLPTEQMLCEPVSRTCQIACGTSANCPEGWVCDGMAPNRFCQNPTCSVTGT